MTLYRIGLVVLILLFAVGFALVFKSVHLPARVRRAEEFMNEEDLSRASAIVKSILDKKKDYVPARYVRARILMKQSQFMLAISELNAILGIPDFNKHVSELDIHYLLADLYSATQQFPKEIDEYREILKFKPEDVKANHRLGHAQYKQKKYKEAKECLSRAITADPSLVDCVLPIGVASYYLSEYDDAEAFLLRAVEHPQSMFEANFYLGVIYKGKKDFDTAIRMFENSRKDRAFFVKSLYHLGEIYFENGLYDKAIEALEEGIGRIDKKDDEALAYRYLLAECFEIENKIKEAVHHWEQIARINSDFRSTRLKLEEYQNILNNPNLKSFFTSSITELQPLIQEVISRLNYNIVSKKEVSHNEYVYKAFNIKRINEPPVLIVFNRTTKEITEGQIINFHRTIGAEKCKSGMYITTSKFSIRARSSASSRMVELYDSTFLDKAVEKIKAKTAKNE
ncbi:MAG TPA: tetratricopeptide repeat protein [Spirochaetota bacterium]|nr:tetratricopeptide repeat protein [Spirochaetota bacterium]